jgi:hypothetical protein
VTIRAAESALRQVCITPPFTVPARSGATLTPLLHIRNYLDFITL